MWSDGLKCETVHEESIAGALREATELQCTVSLQVPLKPAGRGCAVRPITS